MKTTAASPSRDYNGMYHCAASQTKKKSLQLPYRARWHWSMHQCMKSNKSSVFWALFHVICLNPFMLFAFRLWICLVCCWSCILTPAFDGYKYWITFKKATQQMWPASKLHTSLLYSIQCRFNCLTSFTINILTKWLCTSYSIQDHIVLCLCVSIIASPLSSFSVLLFFWGNLFLSSVFLG